MQIKGIKLKNVKSYEYSEVPLNLGLNLIRGDNGSGKSTLQECVGHVLFDVSEHGARDQLRREGASTGTVTIRVISDQDGRVYDVVRDLKNGTLKVHDVLGAQTPLGEIGPVIYPDRQQTLDWLAAEMGIPRKSSKDDYLTTLFDGAIGVPQGAMTGIFLASVGVRQKEFGALLRVDEYRTAYEKLSGTAQSLAGQLALVDHEIALKQGELVRLPGLLQELAELNEQIADLTGRLPFERQRLADADAFAATCERLLGAVQAAEHELELAKGRLTVASENVTRAAAELAEAERAVRACTESSEGYRIYEAARQAQSNLDARRKERDRRLGLLNKTKQDQAAAQAQLRETEDGLTRVAAAERRILELDPLVKEQEGYEAAQREAEQRATKYQSALTEVRRCQDRIRTVLQNLPRIEREVQQREQLGQQLAQLQESRRQKAAEIAGRENTISQLRTDYETARDTLRELEREEQTFTYERGQLEKEKAAIARLRGELEQVRAGLQERARIQTELRSLGETMQRERAAQAAARNEANRCAEALQTLEKRLQALDGKDVPECPICQHPLTPAHARQIITESRAEKVRLTEGQKAALAAEMQANGQIESLQTQERKLQQALEPLPSPTRVGEIERDIAAHETAAQNHTGQIRSLSGIPKKRIDQKAIVDDIKVRGTTLAAQQSAAKKALDALDGEITNLTGKMNPLAQPGRIKELRDEAEGQDFQKCNWQGVAQSFEDAPAQVEAAKAALARLGDPRQERATQVGIASGRQTLESTASKALTTIGQLEENRKIQEAGLQAYATLEADIAENQGLLEQHQAAHERYLAHQKIAASHSTRKAALEGLQAELAIKQGERNERDRKCQDASKLYDVQAHARAKDEAAAARDGVAGMSAQLDGYNTQLQQRNDELAVLREAEEQLCIKQAERDELDHLITTFKSVREGIKSAGSLVTKRRVERISELANSIFQDFMKDDTGREKPLSIRWDEEDYGIIARECGQTIERTFRQLSGGEQMSAALAVRLAILRVMSDLHILFLDEPTANLDSKRRSKLAERIANIGNLKQIFVITHDDTFEPETSTVIQVSKENGVSQIKVGR